MPRLDESFVDARCAGVEFVMYRFPVFNRVARPTSIVEMTVLLAISHLGPKCVGPQSEGTKRS